MRALCWDTETELIRPGLCAPPLVCVQWCAVTAEDASVPGIADELTKLHAGEPDLITWRDATDWAHDALDSGYLLVGHNVAYDLAVLCAHVDTEEFNAKVFKAYDEDRVTDTMHRQKIADIGRGRYRGFKTEGGGWIQTNYDLGDVGKRHGFKVDKSDPWRLRYWELRDVPLDEWPEDAKRYALDDARATAAAFIGQETRYDPTLLRRQFHEARKFWGLQLTSVWGIRTSMRGVLDLERGTRAHLEELQAFLQERDDLQKELDLPALVREDGTRDTKAAMARMVAVCEREGLEVKLTAGGKPSLDSDACKQTGDPVLSAYEEFGSAKKVLSNDVKWMRTGLVAPIHTRFDVADTLRTTSSKPNIQNPRRMRGVRECYVPRGFKESAA